MNLNLDKNVEKLFNSLEKETKVPKERYIASIINGVDNLEDLKDLKDCLDREKNNPKLLNSEEADAFLKSLD